MQAPHSYLALRGGHTTHALTSATDFAPTFVDAAGLPDPRAHGDDDR